jgi:hypothetical protein
MRRRLYFLLPDVSGTQQVVDDLLLARIEARRIHVLGRRDMDLGDLPQANVLQKTDVIHGGQTGMILGAALGAVCGVLFTIFPLGDSSLPLVAILVGSLLGALFGFWTSSLVGAAVPNSRLTPFQVWIERGMLLLMVDVASRDRQRIMDLVIRRHPLAAPGGTEPTIPAFP